MASYERVLMIAGVPCQSFSSTGNRSFNGELLDTTIRVAVEAQVNFLLVECVPDLVRKDELFDQETAEWRALDAGPEGPVLEGWHRECSKAIKKAATGGLKLMTTRVLKDWEHDGATTRERVFLFFERPVSGRLCAPLCVARCMNGGECRDIVGALSPVELVNDKTVVEGSFIPSRYQHRRRGKTGRVVATLITVGSRCRGMHAEMERRVEGWQPDENQRRDGRRQLLMCGQRRHREVGCANQSSLDAGQ